MKLLLVALLLGFLATPGAPVHAAYVFAPDSDFFPVSLGPLGGTAARAEPAGPALGTATFQFQHNNVHFTGGVVNFYCMTGSCFLGLPPLQPSWNGDGAALCAQAAASGGLPDTVQCPCIVTKDSVEIAGFNGAGMGQSGVVGDVQSGSGSVYQRVTARVYGTAVTRHTSSYTMTIALPVTTPLQWVSTYSNPIFNTPQSAQGCQPGATPDPIVPPNGVTLTTPRTCYAFNTASAIDLVASGISPVTAAVQTPATFSATISNNGNTTTGAAVAALFQHATSDTGTNATDIGTVSVAALAATASTPVVQDYTFPSAGTWYLRACADKNSAADTGTITESNETNNCGAWTAITVSSPIQCSDGIDNDGDGRIDSADYGCSTTDDPNEGDNPECSDGSNNDPLEDLLIDYPNDLGCTGYTDPSESPNPGPSGPPSAYIEAAPSRVRTGNAATLGWSAKNVTSCTITGTNGLTPIAAVVAGMNVATATASSGSITTQTAFTISCQPSASDTVIVANTSLNSIEF